MPTVHPGEFYQLDMEMAFATQEDVFNIIEQVLPPVFEKYGIYKAASKAPFTRIPFLEAMDKYGSDKPDLRIDLVLQDATEVLSRLRLSDRLKAMLLKLLLWISLGQPAKSLIRSAMM